MKKIMWVAADTETDNQPVFRSNSSVDLEASSISTVVIGYTSDGEVVHHFKTIEAFMTALAKSNFGGVNKRVKPSEIRIFFHNLKFDMTQIISQWMPWHKHEISELSSVISSNRYYKIQFTYKSIVFTFMDTAKVYPMSLASIAKSLGLEKTKEWDYSKHRKFEDITPEEMHYFDTDIKIVYELLRRTYALGPEANGSNTKLHLTRGSMVLQELKKMRYNQTPAFKSDRLDKRPDYLKYPDLYVHMNIYDLVKFRRAYYGGFVNVQPGLEGQHLAQGISLDYNSMYPSQMLRPMPNWRTMKHYKTPSPYTLEERFKILRIQITQLTLKPDKIPTMPKKSLFGAAQNVMSIKDLKDREQFFTNWDMDFIEKNYNITYTVTEVYEFEYLENMFTAYIEKWKAVKVNATTPFDRNNAKLFLNNGYGKMAQDTLLAGLQQLTIDGEIEQEPAGIILDEGIFKHRLTSEPVDKVEAPNILIAMAITAYARHELFKAIEAVKVSTKYTYYYADTDSVHIGISKETMNVLAKEADKFPTMKKLAENSEVFALEASRIGADIGIAYDNEKFLSWKIESFFTDAKYLRSKTYAELNSVMNNDEIRVAGVNKDGQEKFFAEHSLADFNLGIKMRTLQSAQVRNGTLLYKISKKIG